MSIREIMRVNIAKALGVVILGVSLLWFGPALGATPDYPNRPVTIWVGHPPGASGGLTAQAFADNVKKYLPNKTEPIIVNYKPGAAGSICAKWVLEQPADGYELQWITQDLTSKMAKDAHLLTFGLEDFLYMGCFGYTPALLTVKPGSPFKTFEEFLAYAKKNPGKLSYSTGGIGSGAHLTAEIFQERCGIKLNHIPFAGGAPATTALVGGHVDCAPLTASSLSAFLASGEGAGLRVLATFAKERFPTLMDIPTALEKGYDVDRISYYSLGVKKGTPQPIVDILLKAHKAVADDPDLKQRLVRIGFKPINIGQEETTKLIREEIALSQRIFKKLGLSK